MQDLFSNIFGDKSWYQSLTAWGLIVLVGLTGAASEAAQAGLLSPEVGDVVTSWSTKIGTILTALGIRRAGTAPDVAA